MGVLILYLKSILDCVISLFWVYKPWRLRVQQDGLEPRVQLEPRAQPDRLERLEQRVRVDRLEAQGARVRLDNLEVLQIPARRAIPDQQETLGAPGQLVLLVVLQIQGPLGTLAVRARLEQLGLLVALQIRDLLDTLEVRAQLGQQDLLVVLRIQDLQDTLGGRGLPGQLDLLGVPGPLDALDPLDSLVARQILAQLATLAPRETLERRAVLGTLVLQETLAPRETLDRQGALETPARLVLPAIRDQLVLLDGLGQLAYQEVQQIREQRAILGIPA